MARPTAIAPASSTGAGKTAASAGKRHRFGRVGAKEIAGKESAFALARRGLSCCVFTVVMSNKGARETRLTASAAERFAAPVRDAVFARRTWFSVTLAAVICLHAGLLVFFLWRGEGAPAPAQVAEIPVEVIVQPPPPTPTQTPAPPTPPEKPATSAPRAANNETLERDTTDPDTHAPKNDAPAKDPPKAEPTPPAQAAAATPAPTEQPEPEKANTSDASAAQTEVLDKDAEALAKLTPPTPEPPKRPANLTPREPQHRVAQAKPRRPNQALEQLAGASDLPDYTFAKPMRRHAKITGGTEDDRYLAVVYGMITQRHALGDLPNGDWMVAVAFQVDGDGNLVGAGIQRSSGYAEVDLAALQAVERAAPFPPPPSHATTGLVARLNSGGSPPPGALADGER